MGEPDREEKHYHWDQGHAYVVEGGKSLILINGGAAIGVMTFAGNNHLSVSWLLVVAIGLFALGALSGTLLFMLAYLVALKYGNRDWEVAQRLHDWGYAPAVCGALVFTLGMVLTAAALCGHTTCP